MSEKKPAYPRTLDYFSPGDRVALFLGDWPEDDAKLIIREDWAFGVIGKETACVFGDPRALVISVVFDSPIHNGPDSHLISGLAADPSLMHEWEYHYFLSHPDEIIPWSKKTFGLVSTKMIQSLINLSRL